MSSSARVMSVVWLGLALAACGGGGGGDSAAPSPPSNPPPANSALPLDDTSAVDAAAIVFGTFDRLGLAVEAPIIGLRDLSAGTLQTDTATCFDDTGVVGTIYFTYDDLDGNRRLSAGDVYRTRYDCFGFDHTITMNVTAIDSTRRLEADVRHTAVIADGSRIDGTFRFVSVVNGDRYDQTLSNFELTVAGPRGTIAVHDTTFVRRRTLAGYDFALTGRAVDERGREFSFAMTTPFAGEWFHAPDTGELILTSGVAKARFIPATNPSLRPYFFEYQVDSLGTGYGPLLRGRWNKVTDGSALGLDPNAPPLIESITLSPAAPLRGDAITATIVAIDFDGDPLEYTLNWFVGSSNVASGVTRLEPGFHEKGDVVGLRVNVSDGRSTTIGTAEVTVGNTPPTGSVRIEPAAPTSSDDIVVFPGSADDDYDVPTITFEWFRNGVLLVGQTGQTLPHASFAKGDTITVVATLDDGDDETRLPLTTVVADTPALISAPYDMVVDFGAVAAFGVTWSDFDPSDMFPGFVLTHGPAGMTVNRTTGEVRWRAAGPMFDEELAVAWGVALDTPGGARSEGLIYTSDPGRAYPLLRTGMRAPLAHGLAAGDFDGDGRAEAFVAGGGAAYELDSASSGYRQSWAYPFALESDPGSAAVAAADVNDADGRAEVFVATPLSVTKLDGVTRRSLGTASFGSVPGLELRQIAVADLNRDGRAELIALENLDGSADPAVRSRLTIMRADTWEWFRVLDEMDFGSSFAVGNVDSDAALEIVTNGGYVIDGGSVMAHAPQAVQRKQAVFGWQIDVGDTNGDAVAEIAASTADADVRIYQYNAGTQNFDVALTIPNVDTDAVLVADISGTSTPEIVVGDGVRGAGALKVYRRNGATAAQLFSLPSGGDRVVSIAAADFDGDGARELLVGIGGAAEGLALVEGNGTVAWTSTSTPQVGPGVFVGGELVGRPGSSRAPLFAVRTAGDRNLRTVVMDPTTGDTAFGAVLPQPVSDSVRLRVADYDNDSHDEAFIAAESSSGAYQLAYDVDSGATEYTSAAVAGEQASSALGYGDLNADGRADLVAVSVGGIVRAYDVAGHQPLFSLPLPAGQTPVAAAVANLSGDDAAEIVVAGTDRLMLVARDASGSYRHAMTSAASYENLRDVIVADIDGDGSPDVFVLYGALGSRVDRLGADLVSRGGFFVEWPSSPGLAVEESAFARKNLVLYENRSTPVIAVVDPLTGTPIWSSSRLQGSIARGGVHFVDVAGDGRRRVSVATSEGMLITR